MLRVAALRLIKQSCPVHFFLLLMFCLADLMLQTHRKVKDLSHAANLKQGKGKDLK